MSNRTSSLSSPLRDPVDLLAAAIAAFAAAGAHVRLFAGADNSVRPREAGEPGEAIESGEAIAAASLPYVVEVEGLPNLLHELAHVVLLGRVEKDHATDYSKIPFDLTNAPGRTLLFEELACCVASCTWHPGDDAAAQAWFAEQVGIQGLFFGFDRDLAGFLAAADAEVRVHRAELDGAIARAIAGVAAQLRSGGASDATARPRHALAFDALWRRLAEDGAR